jgi:hypothetical protein
VFGLVFAEALHGAKRISAGPAKERRLQSLAALLALREINRVHWRILCQNGEVTG